MEMLEMREALCVRAEGVWEIIVPPRHFFCELQTLLESKIN